VRALNGQDIDPRGWFVYILWNSANKVIYVGQSRNVLHRVGSHVVKHGDQIARVSLIRCASRRRMELTEDWLIDLFQPPLNIVGTWDEQARWEARHPPVTDPGGEPPTPEPLPEADDLAVLATEPVRGGGPPHLGPVVPVSTEVALATVRQQIAAWRAQGGGYRRFTIPDLRPVRDQLGRSRPWLNLVLSKLEEVGEIRRDGATWIILDENPAAVGRRGLDL